MEVAQTLFGDPVETALQLIQRFASLVELLLPLVLPLLQSGNSVLPLGTVGRVQVVGGADESECGHDNVWFVGVHIGPGASGKLMAIQLVGGACSVLVGHRVLLARSGNLSRLFGSPGAGSVWFWSGIFLQFSYEVVLFLHQVQLDADEGFGHLNLVVALEADGVVLIVAAFAGGRVEGVLDDGRLHGGAGAGERLAAVELVPGGGLDGPRDEPEAA